MLEFLQTADCETVPDFRLLSENLLNWISPKRTEITLQKWGQRTISTCTHRAKKYAYVVQAIFEIFHIV